MSNPKLKGLENTRPRHEINGDNIVKRRGVKQLENLRSEMNQRRTQSYIFSVSFFGFNKKISLFFFISTV